MNRSVRDEKLNDEDAQSIEDLERELFGALQPAQDRPAGTAVPAPARRTAAGQRPGAYADKDLTPAGGAAGG